MYHLLVDIMTTELMLLLSYMFSYNVQVTEWPSLGKYLLAQHTMFLLYQLQIANWQLVLSQP